MSTGDVLIHCLLMKQIRYMESTRCHITAERSKFEFLIGSSSGASKGLKFETQYVSFERIKSVTNILVVVIIRPLNKLITELYNLYRLSPIQYQQASQGI